MEDGAREAIPLVVEHRARLVQGRAPTRARFGFLTPRLDASVALSTAQG